MSLPLAAEGEKESTVVEESETIVAADLEGVCVAQSVEQFSFGLHLAAFDAGTHRRDQVGHRDRGAVGGVAAAERVASRVSADRSLSAVEVDEHASDRDVRLAIADLFENPALIVEPLCLAVTAVVAVTRIPVGSLESQQYAAAIVH